MFTLGLCKEQFTAHFRHPPDPLPETNWNTPREQLGAIDGHAAQLHFNNDIVSRVLSPLATQER